MSRAFTARVAAAATGLVRRPLRLAAAAVGDLLSLACAGALLLLVLAQPAMQETGPGWLGSLRVSADFLARDGSPIGHRGIRHDDSPRLDEYPAHLIAAVLATEDRRFRTHLGLDPVGLARAFLANGDAGAVVQGGSTITQQLAKNLFLTGDRTFERKIKEAFLAVWLEARLGKDEILKLYLDRAYMGAGAYGMEAAARTYFGKSVRDVTLAEAATLAGLLKAPARFAPTHPAAAQARAATVLDRMVAAGAITRTEREEALRRPAVAVAAGGSRGPDHFLDWAFRDVQRLAMTGLLRDEARLTVETTLDPRHQAEAEGRIAEALDRDGNRLAFTEGAAIVMDPGGAIRAMVGGRHPDESAFNRATDALRQPGSAFKPFVYAAALAHGGFRPGTIVPDEPICFAGWCPRNYSRTFAGPVTLTGALAQSLNSVAVRLPVEIGRHEGELTTARQADLGRNRVIELAGQLGVRTPLRNTPTLPLGSSEVTLLDLVTGFAAFANGGLAAPPYGVASVRDPAGTILFRRDRDAGPRRRVLGADLAGEMNSMLVAAVGTGTGRRAALPGHRVAGKTGTTSSYRDAWFVGYTAHLVGGVWLGNDDGRPMLGVTGGAVPAAIWRGIMVPAHRALPPMPLPSGPPEAVARASGAFVDVATTGSTGGGFSPAPAARSGFTVVGR